MNREIEFRGFDGTKWYYGDLKYNIKVDVAMIHIYEKDGSFYRQYNVDPDTVGQFTGLRDKNGKKIYEGDVVRHPYVDPIFRDLVESKDGEGVTSEIVFHDGAFVVKYNENDFIYLDAFTRRVAVEVIGNIYDNPELLDKR
jgi:uncharacterized phage protein (TIGR01671 family)